MKHLKMIGFLIVAFFTLIGMTMNAVTVYGSDDPAHIFWFVAQIVGLITLLIVSIEVGRKLFDDANQTKGA